MILCFENVNYFKMECSLTFKEQRSGLRPLFYSTLSVEPSAACVNNSHKFSSSPHAVIQYYSSKDAGTFETEHLSDLSLLHDIGFTVSVDCAGIMHCALGGIVRWLIVLLSVGSKLPKHDSGKTANAC